MLHLDELKAELRRASTSAFTPTTSTPVEKKDVPNYADPRADRARQPGCNRYLRFSSTRFLGRADRVNTASLKRHFAGPTAPALHVTDRSRPRGFREAHRAIARSTHRSRPRRSSRATTRLARPLAHTLGYIGSTDDVRGRRLSRREFNLKKLKTFTMPGTVGENGLERGIRFSPPRRTRWPALSRRQGWL